MRTMPLPKGLRDWIIPRPVRRGQPAIAPGLYHFRRETDDGFLRFHLRVDYDGHGLLIAGASEAARLLPPGTEIAKRLLGGETADQLIAGGNYPDSSSIEQVAWLIGQLGRPTGRFPIFNLADPATSDRQLQLMAPFQADVVPGDFEALKTILPRLWQAGVPHVRFISSSNDDRLVDAVTRAEDIGMIAGVRLSLGQLGEALIIELAEAGLDYIVVPWGVSQSLHASIYEPTTADAMAETVRLIRRYEMCPVIEIPLIEETEDALEENLSSLTDWQIDHVEVFAIASTDEPPDDAPALTPFPAPALRQLAAWIEDLAAERPWQVVWLPSVKYETDTNVAHLAAAGPRAGGDVTIRIEANGDVIPPRGPRQPAGNLLKQDWNDIWRHPRFTRYRQRVESGTHCDQCPGLAICAADCPADPGSWASPS